MSGLLATDLHLEHFRYVKMIVPVPLFALFWCWETGRPFFGFRENRWRHAGRNLLVALSNTFVLGLVFGSLTTSVAELSERNQFGLLHTLNLAVALRFVMAFVLLDSWTYLWHRLNHTLPILWRFHRMHHSDDRMDVTTATRFHLGEHVGSSLLRLGLIPLLGLEVWQVVLYDTAVVATTMLHHADISLGRWDHWFRWVIVTPDMHKVHHSRRQPETDSNYSTVLSLWDRLAGSYRTQPDLRTISFGLDEFAAPNWQSLWGMLRTPFITARNRR